MIRLLDTEIGIIFKALNKSFIICAALPLFADLIILSMLRQGIICQKCYSAILFSKYLLIFDQNEHNDLQKLRSIRYWWIRWTPGKDTTMINKDIKAWILDWNWILQVLWIKFLFYLGQDVPKRWIAPKGLRGEPEKTSWYPTGPKKIH